MSDPTITAIINQILSQKSEYDTESAHLQDEQIYYVFDRVKEILKEEPTLLKISSPVTVVGDVHGQLYDLRIIFDKCGYPSTKKYLFLGDYVDKGFRDFDTILLLLCYKILNPHNVYLLRGNHELSCINKYCGLFDIIKNEYENGQIIYEKVNEIFDYLSLAAIVDEQIFCVHGGISKHLNKMEDLNEIKKPVNECLVFENNHFIDGLVTDLLWAECDKDIDYWRNGNYGYETFFGYKAVEDFLTKFNLKLICRGHEYNKDGIEYNFSPHKSFITIFSAPFYRLMYDNTAAVIHFNKSLDFEVSKFEPKLPKLDPEKAITYRSIIEAEKEKEKLKKEKENSFCEIY